MVKKIYFLFFLSFSLCACAIDSLYHEQSFSKLLEHDPQTGLLTQSGSKNFQKLQHALFTGKQKDFNAIERTADIERLWANPQAAFARTLPGLEPESFHVSAPPALSSEQAAAELIELYLMALCRDVYFSDYGTSVKTDTMADGRSFTQVAAQILSNLSDYKGPTRNGIVETNVLFRGSTKGDLTGPYISQFLVQPYVPLFPTKPNDVGAAHLSKEILTRNRTIPIMQQREFGVCWQDFIALQNGFIPKKFVEADCDKHHLRHIIDGRDMACFVYTDVSFDAYYYAINVLACNDFPYSKSFPYQNKKIKNEAAGLCMGLADVYSMVAAVCTHAYKVCWYYKWRVFNRVRPEAMAGFVHQAIVTGNNRFNLAKSLFNPELLDLILAHNQKQALKSVDTTQSWQLPNVSTYLLAMAYPEGSPTHPSYPSAHATIAGACTTIIKAFFDDTALLNSKITLLVPDAQNPTKLKPYKSAGAHHMTVGSELDKLASNIAYGRSWAGVHYRSDNEAGLQLGEQVAIRYLQYHGSMYHEEDFKGYELTKRDGTRVRITPDSVIVINKKNRIQKK